MSGAISIPKTTPGYVIFPYDQENRKFTTSDYSPAQTKGRASVEEIEQFLNEVNYPLARWTEEYGAVHQGTGVYLYLCLLFLILFPLLLFYICYLSAKQNEAQQALRKVKQEIMGIIHERGGDFADKGLEWKVPTQITHWIELWVGKDGRPQRNLEMAPYPQYGYPQADMRGINMVPCQQPGYPQGDMRGIPMVSYQQQGYPQYGDQVVPVQDWSQQQFMSHSGMYGGGQQEFS